ncbi:TPA: 50S ribosomal protein L30e [Candidatus Bathyarchaeota archaeon]|nr:50S ribosomal protein L30e [Candidatus Bathyarchaeota archaeon]
MVNFDQALGIAVKTGKVLFGANSTIKNVMTSKVRLAIVASNCPDKVRKDIEKYCKLSEIPLIVSPRNNVELGRVCGKPFPISALAIRDPGDSDILKIAEKRNV